MRHIIQRAVVAIIAAFSLSVPHATFAEPGVTKDEIVFGQSAAFGGPAKALGQGMKAGILAAFAEANRKGGVKGREIKVKHLDDGYEPNRAISNTKALIEREKVFALIGGVGTPTSKAAQPIASAAKVPYIGPFTGAQFLRWPHKPWVVNVRGSYFQETETWIERLTTDLGIKRIAILYQDDSFGRAGLNGVNRALRRRGLELVAEGTYRRNTTAVKTSLLHIRKHKPEAVVMVGAYKPIAAFIKYARSLKMNPVFVNISFVGSRALAAELGPLGAGVIVTQVIPFPHDTSIPLVRDYQAALKALDPDLKPGFVSLEGYLVGRVTIAALQNIEGEITRKSFIDAIVRTGTFDIGGVKLTYGPKDNQGMDKVYLTVLQKDGTYRAVTSFTRQSAAKR